MEDFSSKPDGNFSSINKSAISEIYKELQIQHMEANRLKELKEGLDLIIMELQKEASRIINMKCAKKPRTHQEKNAENSFTRIIAFIADSDNLVVKQVDSIVGELDEHESSIETFLWYPIEVQLYSVRLVY